ncbi:MAG: hypothetical protein H6553_10690 [Chitinophagales bacterium]|nr:hypothetical protein [Chitinophagales bacterium]
MKKLFGFGFFILIIVTIFNSTACKNDKNKNVAAENAIDSLEHAYDLLPEEQQQIINIVKEWNTVHNDTAYFDDLINFYNYNVLFYKKNFSANSVVATKKYRIKGAKTYRQLIIGRIGIYPSDTGEYKCEFLKMVNINNKAKVYHSYLIFDNINGEWKIIVESDKESDNRPDMVSLFESFQESESKSKGDFNGDGEDEDLIIIKPQQDSTGKYITTKTKISFTNFDLPEIEVPNCVGVNVLNENDVDGDGSDDFSIVVKKPDGSVGDVILFAFHRGKWEQIAKFKAPSKEVFGSRQNLIEFAGSGNVKIRTAVTDSLGNDSLIIKTISTWE